MMSAFAEFERERQQIDELLRQGYRIVSLRENLDGAIVKFALGEPEQAAAELLLLTADARKYAGTCVFLAQREVRST
ncbi:MAG: hypothetical protein E7E23_05665 [Paenibacillus sp.]|uniref:hypothetical protein n=1 Tax=Paenibacillus sp. TaxID=58172 RepID=UPI0028FF7248|nr:hypothetical protein [Paenibacillus sp.]MDU2240046.1 hypothetical protein [Paenibacillus sp.]